jgi:methionyl-tRNA formyltransferase
MNIALVAEKSIGVNALRAIVASPHRLVTVLTSPIDDGVPSVWKEAIQLGFAPQPATLVKAASLAESLRSFDVDLIINVHSLYRIHSDVLLAARVAALNLHPGPLPRYAGLNAPSWAIYRGEDSYGVTLHRMSTEIDAGPIVYKSIFPIAPDDTALTLNWRCWKDGLILLGRLLKELVSSDKIPSQPQDRSLREYFGKAVPQNGRINWFFPAREVHNFVRACDFFPYPSPWGIPQATYQGNVVGILKTSLTGQPANAVPGTIAVNKSSVRVACADQWLTLEAIWASGRARSANEVITSSSAFTNTDTDKSENTREWLH